MRFGSQQLVSSWAGRLARLFRRPGSGPLTAALIPLAAIAATGGDVVLFWSTSGADTVELLPGIGAVRPVGWTRVTLPPGRHRLTLRATRGSETVEASASVLVLAGPRIVADGLLMPRIPRCQLPPAPRAPAAPALLMGGSWPNGSDPTLPPVPLVLATGGPVRPRFRLAALTDAF